MTNGGMEGTYVDLSAGGGGTVDVAPNWNKHNIETDGTDELSKETTIVHSGSASQKVAVDSGSEGIDTSSNVFSNGKWHNVTVWLYSTLGKVLVEGSGFLSEAVTPSATWTEYTWITKATSNARLAIKSKSNAATFYVDDVSVVEL